MKYRVLCHILVFLLCVDGLSAQETQKDSAQVTMNDRRLASNNVFLELIGNGLFYSVNYERTIARNFSLRIGVSYVSFLSGNNNFGTVPLLVNAFIGEGAHRFEAGLGVTTIIGATTIVSYNLLPCLTGRLAYRYQPLEGGLNFAVAYTPFLYGIISAPLWGGISIGWGF